MDPPGAPARFKRGVPRADGDRTPLVPSQRTHRTLTRRGLLASGGAAGAAALVALNPRAASAITAIGDDPAYLRRSGYVRLVGQDFAAGRWEGAANLTLADVADIGGMTGRDDAFALHFVGPEGIASGIQTLSHPSLGSFSLMISPVNPAAPSQEYEAIVDRSKGLTRVAAPRPPKRPPTPPTSERERELVSHAQLRQGRQGLRCEIVFLHRVHPKTAHASLLRDGKTAALSDSRKVRDRRVTLRLTRGRRLSRGRYELIVGIGAGDRVERLTVKLR
jgi:hypothetical protein